MVSLTDIRYQEFCQEFYYRSLQASIFPNNIFVDSLQTAASVSSIILSFKNRVPLANLSFSLYSLSHYITISYSFSRNLTVLFSTFSRKKAQLRTRKTFFEYFGNSIESMSPYIILNQLKLWSSAYLDLVKLHGANERYHPKSTLKK